MVRFREHRDAPVRAVAFLVVPIWQPAPPERATRIKKTMKTLLAFLKCRLG